MRQKNANDSGKEYTGYIRIIDCQNAKIVNKILKLILQSIFTIGERNKYEI